MLAYSFIVGRHVENDFRSFFSANAGTGRNGGPHVFADFNAKASFRSVKSRLALTGTFCPQRRTLASGWFRAEVNQRCS